MANVIIRSKMRLAPSLAFLNALTLKYIFDRKNMSATDEALLIEGIDAWTKKVNRLPFESKSLRYIAEALMLDKQGHYNSMKHAIRKSGLHYTKFFPDGL